MSSVDSRHSLIEEGHRFRPKAVPFSSRARPLTLGHHAI
jgi:hypothetical protein